jgi:hypothetical protein
MSATARRVSLLVHASALVVSGVLFGRDYWLAAIGLALLASILGAVLEAPNEEPGR